MLNAIYVILILLVCKTNEAARILAVFPAPSISHQVVFRPLTQELAKKGHEVVVITPDPAFPNGQLPPNLTEIDVHDISYNIWRAKFMAAAKGKQDDFLAQVRIALEALNAVVEVQLQDEQIQNMLLDKNRKFDLVLSEACVRLSLIYSHIYNAPAILVSSLGATQDNFATVGASSHPFLYPPMSYHKLNNLTSWEKLTQFYKHYVAEQVAEALKESENKILKKYGGNDTPTVDELANNVHMLFLNINPIFDGIRPVPPNVIYMGGGLHQKPDKELPTDLKSYLDNSENGVIYISFGTNVDPSLLPLDRIQTLVQTFSKLPYDILWKWNKDELPGRTENIRISKWLPQADLLKHPKLKLFITQGGLQSTDEAITAGVPLIGMPMLGDQWYNVEKYVTHKIGLRLDMESLTEEKLTESVNTIITDDSYRRNIIRLRELMRDQPMKPLERAVWWTEYLLRHGGAKHLKSPSANITWAQYLELELVSYLLAMLLTVAIILIIAIRFIYNFLMRNCFSIKVKSS